MGETEFKAQGVKGEDEVGETAFSKISASALRSFSIHKRIEVGETPLFLTEKRLFLLFCQYSKACKPAEAIFYAI